MVAGYGPVGAVLAALLGQRGVSVVVVEPRAEVYPVPRAVATDAEALRILSRLPGMDGLLERVNGVQRTVLVGPGPSTGSWRRSASARPTSVPRERRSSTNPPWSGTCAPGWPPCPAWRSASAGR